MNDAYPGDVSDRLAAPPAGAAAESAGDDTWPAPPPAAPAAERDLARRLRGGDAAALETFVRISAGRMFPLVRRLVGRPDEARHVVEAGIRAALAAASSRDPDLPIALFTDRMAVESVRRHERARRAAGGELRIEDLLPRFLAGGGHAAPVVDWWGSARVRSGGPARALVREAIGRLPLEHRLVLVLRDVEGRTAGEAAAVLGVVRASVEKRLNEARQALSTLLARAFVPDGECRAAGAI